MCHLGVVASGVAGGMNSACWSRRGRCCFRLCRAKQPVFDGLSERMRERTTLPWARHVRACRARAALHSYTMHNDVTNYCASTPANIAVVTPHTPASSFPFRNVKQNKQRLRHVNLRRCANTPPQTHRIQLPRPKRILHDRPCNRRRCARARARASANGALVPELKGGHHKVAGRHAQQQQPMHQRVTVAL